MLRINKALHLTSKCPPTFRSFALNRSSINFQLTASKQQQNKKCALYYAKIASVAIISTVGIGTVLTSSSDKNDDAKRSMSPESTLPFPKRANCEANQLLQENRKRDKAEAHTPFFRKNISVRPGRKPINVMIHRMRSLRSRPMNEKYIVDWRNVIGEGAYGSVHPARLAATREKVALKKISKRYTNSSNFKTETDALLRIYDNGGHPNISGLRDMYEDNAHYYLILDLVSGGEMFEHLIQYGAYSEANASRLMREVASALAFLHGVGVVHADLKPENLLLCSKKASDGTIKVIDFGCAVMAPADNYYDDLNAENGGGVTFNDQGQEVRNVPQRTTPQIAASTGTTAYWPPERFVKGSSATAASDMWAAGAILFIMLAGVHPFDLQGMSADTEIEERIKTNPLPPIGPNTTGHLSESALNVIRRLMDPDPNKRLTAYEMMKHPWIRGETATTEKIERIDKKLSRFQDLKNKLEAGIFAVLVSNGTRREHNLSEAKVSDDDDDGEKSRQHIMKRAFESFDSDGKGFVSPNDLGRVVNKFIPQSKANDSDWDGVIQQAALEGESETLVQQAALEGESDTSQVSNGLTLSEFSQLFSRLNNVHVPKGHFLFKAGDDGDAMYFINSGKVEVLTRKGQLVSILRQGDFFGEGSLLEEDNKRFSSARAAAPTDLMKISREEFERYIASSKIAKQQLKLVWKSRTLNDAKNLIRLQTKVKTRLLKKGDIVYKEGEVGKSMFMVHDQDGGEFEVRHKGVKVHNYYGGDSFGETSVIMQRPRSSTVSCSSDNCKLIEMDGSDFLAATANDPQSATSIRDMCRKRMFKKAVKNLSLEKKRGFSMDDLVAAFHDADTDGNGYLALQEIRNIMHRIDPTFPEEEIKAMLKYIDIDEDGQMGPEDFKRMFRVFDEKP